MTESAINDLIYGREKYQIHARRAFPMLVRQAEAGYPVTYSDLAEELGMHHRPLNRVLGLIGRTLQELSKQRKKEIPPLQCVVINKNTGFPGEGIKWFLKKKKQSYSGVGWKEFGGLSKARQRKILQAELQKVFLFDGWRNILETLSLDPISDNFSDILKETKTFGGGGESNAHKELKEYVAQNPASIKLPKKSPKGQIEYRLASGDVLDVSFSLSGKWLAAEVKSRISSKDDIVRGLFQCVKYKAVMAAMQLVEKSDASVEAVLVLEGEFPKCLVPLRNMLAVTVYKNVKPS